MHQCGWPHLPMSLSWIFWIKSAWPTWHSSSIVSCRSGWCTSLAVTTVKRYFRELRSIRLQPENDAYTPITGTDNIQVLGKVIAVFRML